jgi:hypothetical protein
MMLLPALLLTLVGTVQAPAETPPVQARAQTRVLVQIIQAAEVKGGVTSSPHQRSVRRDEAGQTLILVQFE